MTTRGVAVGDHLQRWRDTQLEYDGDLFSYSEYTREVIREGHRLVVDLCARLASGRHASLTVVDVGCGWTDFYPKLAPLIRTYIGVEPSARQIRRAPARDNARLIRGVGEQLVVSDGAADVVLLISILDHCLDAAAVLEEAFRVLRPGGTAILLLENRGRLSNFLRRLLGIPLQHGDEHLGYFDVDDVRALVEPHGTVTFVRSYGYLLGFDHVSHLVPRRFVAWLRWLADTLCSPLLVGRGQHFVISVEKPGGEPARPLAMQCPDCRQSIRWSAAACDSCHRPFAWIDGRILDLLASETL